MYIKTTGLLKDAEKRSEAAFSIIRKEERKLHNIKKNNEKKRSSYRNTGKRNTGHKDCRDRGI